MTVCPACQATVREDQKFCPRCGKPLPMVALLEAPVHVPSLEQEEPEPAVLFCPVCQALYPASAAYCEADGTPLEKIEKYVLSSLDEGKVVSGPAMPPSGEEEASALNLPSKDEGEPLSAIQTVRPRTGPWARRRLILSAALIVIIFVAGYYYFGGYGGRTVTVGKEINAALKTRGLDLTASVDKSGEVTLSGSVKSQADHDAALNIVKSHEGAKGVRDNLTVTASPIETERALNKALDAAGLTGVQTQVDSDFRVVLSGVVRNERENVLAVKTVKAFPDVRSTQNMIKVEKGSSAQGAGSGNGSFGETRRFALASLSPSSWASLKYRDTVAFRVPGPGRLTVEASWEPQETLALMVNNAATNVSHAQKDGASPLKLTYRITPADFAEGPQWEATIANFTARGPVKGTLKVSFVSAGASPRPVFDASKTEKELNEALKAEGLTSVIGEVSKNGTATLKGSAPTAEAKERALAVAGRIKSIKAVKDIIFVVGS